MRVLSHLLSTRWTLTRRFPPHVLDAIGAAVAESETRHRGEIRVAIEAALDIDALWRMRAARARALEVFTELGVWDTRERNGVLIYILIAEHDVEIVADRGAAAVVQADEWRDVCASMEAEFRQGRWQEGVIAGIEGVTRLLAREYPSHDAGGEDEQPNRPHVL